MNHTRREFMNLTGGAFAGLVAQTVGGENPDVIVVNAKVYTMDARAPRAEAFAVTTGRFTAVGSTADIKGLARKNTQRLMPGA